MAGLSLWLKQFIGPPRSSTSAPVRTLLQTLKHTPFTSPGVNASVLPFSYIGIRAAEAEVQFLKSGRGTPGLVKRYVKRRFFLFLPTPLCCPSFRIAHTTNASGLSDIPHAKTEIFDPFVRQQFGQLSSNSCFWKPNSCMSVELATTISSVPRRNWPGRAYFGHERASRLAPRRLVRFGAFDPSITTPGHQLGKHVADCLRTTSHDSNSRAPAVPLDSTYDHASRDNGIMT